MSSTKIVGPFWEADVRVVRLADPVRNRALRALFVENSISGHQAHPATTQLMLAEVQEVRVEPLRKRGRTYVWIPRPGDSSSKPVDDEELEELVRSGKLALLLVESSDRRNQYICLAGEINLDRLRPQRNARGRVFQDLALEEADPGQRSGATSLAGAATVHSSGLSIYGLVALPWQDEPVAAPFQLTERLPGPGARLTIEVERLTGRERTAWIEAWAKLSAYVNPARPLAGTADATPPVPHWVTLEVANPEDVPQLYWEWNPSDASAEGEPKLHFQTGQINLLLSDQQPYDQQHPPTSLARIVPQDISVTRDGDALLVVVNEHPEQEPAPNTLRYSFTTSNQTRESAPAEELTLAEAQVAFDPVQTAQFLRQHQDLPTPEWGRDTPVEPAILWGFMPLADGWAQLPVPNLSEQIYLDAELEQFGHAPEEIPPALLQGAVIFGNDTPNVIARHPDEQPWNLVLTDAQGVTGVWTLTPGDANGFQLGDVTLDIVAPSLVVNGLFWLSTGQPTATDALPDLEDWTTGLASIALRTVDPERDLFPPLVTVTLGDQDQHQPGPVRLSLRQEQDANGEQCGVSALLNTWSLSYQVDQDLFDTMQEKNVLPQNAFSRHLPWIWRHHPTLPMVQALPLTQSQSPPNYASPSRQLVPFELGIDSAWTFGVPGDAGNGAATWPISLSQARPAQDWQDRADLPLVALSLPGLVLDPSLEGVGPGNDDSIQLPFQYRYDLPYTDEINALAQLPEVVPDPEKVSPLPDSPPPEPAPPLTRETFAEHWARLSEQASLAAADAVEAFENDGQAAVRHLVEPFDWMAQPTLDLDVYPGTLSLADDTDSLVLSRESALRGISGRFAATVTDGQIGIAGETAKNPFLIEAGSMAAHGDEDGMYRDQRGLWRGDSLQLPVDVAQDEKLLIKTPVLLQHKDAEQNVAYDLTSALAPFELVLDDPTTPWQIWFRDLPVRHKDGTFDRSQVRSDRAQDVNDPEALSREHDYLAGYEWRLGVGATSSTPLPLFGLHFYPLTLEKMVFNEETAQSIEVVGRLQLPLADPRELEDLSNAVRLIFEGDAGELRLQEIALESDVGEWPLALERGEDSGAPHLQWEEIELVDRSIRVRGVRLRFFLFGVEWTHPLSHPLDFPQAGMPQTSNLPASTSLGLQPRELELTLDPEDGMHQLSVTLDIGLGKQDKDAAVPRLQATVKYDLLGQGAGTATLISADLLEDLKLSGGARTIPVGERAIQFDLEWSQEAELQLLPGMGLHPNSSAPGFAALTFTATAQPDSGVPALELTSAFVEALLSCRWNEGLQDGAPGDDATNTQVLRSSAGDLAVGYTTQLQAGTWQESLLLNGFLEVKNLVSWPTELIHPTTGPAEPTRLVLPAIPEDGKLDHTRHTIRVLFNQHQVPAESLLLSPSNKLFFHLDKPWQFLAVVEHQLVDVEPVDGWETFATSNDRRWTTLQEVRLVAPSRFRDFLEENRDDSRAGHDPDLDYGYLAGGLPSLLQDALDELPETTLIVEASAPHWIHREPLTAARWTRLQFLPNGSQHGILSGPADYGPSDPRDPEWLLLPMPFLGRLQDAESDDPPQNGGANALQVDPILLLRSQGTWPDLAGALAHWRREGSAPMEVLVSGFDTALGRTWARLDPTSLEENWFRLQNPIPEPQPTATQSVMAALPDTPARLSRATALRRAFDAFRPAYPPALPAGLEWPVIEIGDGIVWRRNSVLVMQGVSIVQDSDTSRKNRIRNGSFKPRKASDRSPKRGWQVTAGANRSPARWQVSRVASGPRIRIVQGVSLEPGRYRFSVSVRPPSEPKRSRVVLFASHGGKRIAEHVFGTTDFPPGKWTRVQVAFDMPAPGGAVRVGVVLSRGWYLDRAELALVSPGGWHITAAQLRGIRRDGQGPQRHAAATLMPAQLNIDGEKNPRPLSLAVSPYLGLEFRPSGTQGLIPHLASVELLCLDQASGLLRPAASRLWELLGESMNIDVFKDWARETHLRLCPASPIAVLRFREINKASDDDADSRAHLTTTYRFAVVPGLDLPATLARRVFRLRTAVDQLRFREGQFGGNEMPEQIVPFEIAPPQTTGVQPLYLTERPATAMPGAWPWGLSALRLSVQYTPGKEGVIGASGEPSNGSGDRPLTLWWQAPRYFVQYRSALASDRPVWVLPALYRARAIKSLLPVLPAPPLPALDMGENTWQPVLPGALCYLISGARAGVLFAIRNQLLRQSGLKGRQKGQVGKGMVSGSVPVQHRMPRPVPLPPNQNRERALQTWASFFEPETNLLAGPSPADEAFFAANGDAPARRLQIKLLEPARGALTAAWNGELVFDIQAQSDGEAGAIVVLEWVEVKVTDGDQTFACELQTWEERGVYRASLDAEAVRKLLEGRLAGQILTANAYVGHDTHTDGFRQTLSFPLRIVDEARPPLPLAPHFVHFEDPEYNRRLSSPAAVASGTMKDEELHTVTLATDRREYNPDSRLALRYDWDDEITAGRSATLAFSRVDQNGIETALTVQGPSANLVGAVPPGKLVQLSLLDLYQDDEPVPWEPGDTLQLKLAVPNASQPDLEIYLEVRIVETAVIPAPEAAYALLRWQNDGTQVLCARFAWRPNASRVELICAEDLRTEVVRRRAIFQWGDSVRPGTLNGYAVQKIAPSGATHFPDITNPLTGFVVADDKLDTLSH